MYGHQALAVFTVLIVNRLEVHWLLSEELRKHEILLLHVSASFSPEDLFVDQVDDPDSDRPTLSS